MFSSPSPALVTVLAALTMLAACTDPSTPGAEDAAEEPRPVPADRPAVEWALAIHGGAGNIGADMEEERRRMYHEALGEALRAGSAILEEGGSSLDAVERVVLFLEDHPEFNAGKGAVYTHQATHELDAAIMDGSTLNAGAVAGVTTVKNPIRLARLVLERSPHVFLIGAGAEAFAEEAGLERVDPSYFDTERRRESLERAIEREKETGSWTGTVGTVGAVARDRQGNLAAATSTGGITNKRFGRVGDVPVIGAGTYANDATCAVSATGKGEEIIKHTVARSIAALVELGGLDLETAVHRVVHEAVAPAEAGVIAVDPRGTLALSFNTTGMYRGAADSSGRLEIAIWK